MKSIPARSLKKASSLASIFFGTAIAYQNGTSEQYLGRAIKDFAKRDEVVIAAKFLVRTKQEIQQGVSGQRHIAAMLDRSLQTLGMKYVDIYIYHMWDYAAALYDIMEGVNAVLKAGKVRYVGISNCYVYQLAFANALAEQYGFAKFIVVQGHYNLIFRQEEREMAKLCDEAKIAMTPYSALAGERLSKLPGETSKRLREDAYARLKYDACYGKDRVIIERVTELAGKHGVFMMQFALAWLLAKTAAPVVGATNPAHIEDAVKALDLTLSAREMAYLEEPYVAHNLVGVMARNSALAVGEKHVWSVDD